MISVYLPAGMQQNHRIRPQEKEGCTVPQWGEGGDIFRYA